MKLMLFISLHSSVTGMYTCSVSNKHSQQYHVAVSQWAVYVDQRQSEAEERLQPGTVQSFSVSLGFVSWLYEKQPDFQAIFNPGACHLPNEWPSFLDSWTTHSLSCHETSEPTVLLFTAEDCIQRPHLHTFRVWPEWSIIIIVIIMRETVYGHSGWLLSSDTACSHLSSL